VWQEVAPALLLLEEMAASLLEGIQPGCEFKVLSPGWGGVQLDLLYILLSKSSLFSMGLLAKYILIVMSLESLSKVWVWKYLNELVNFGVGMNFKPLPSSGFMFGGRLKDVVRLWKA